MRDKAFLERLRKELPQWVEQGWLAPDHEQIILDHTAAQVRGVRRAPLAFAVLGVLVFGAGVITFFAANWAGMAKLTKLAVLFGSLWSAYAAAGWLLASKDTANKMLGEALLFLGVILFGANIMLIAQIYHLAGHYPNAVLMWALGALAVIYLVPTQTAAVTGLILTALWSGMEVFDFERPVHWPFLIVWALFLPPIYRRAWKYGAAAAMLALFAWSLYISIKWLPDDRVFLTQVYLLLSLGVFVLGAAMESKTTLAPFSVTVQRFALVAVLISFYALTLRDMHGLGTYLKLPEVASTSWIIGTLIAAAAAVGLAVWHQRGTSEEHRPVFVKWGHVLLAAIVVLILANLFVPKSDIVVLVVYICYNVLYFAGIIWLIYAGHYRNDRFRVNIGFVLFSLQFLTLYFDTFWTLMDRSGFFMASGVLVIVGGYFLEKLRRRALGSGGRTPGEGETR